MNKKIAFCTYVSDDKITYFGLLKMLTSYKKFHPDIPIYVLTNKHIFAELKKLPMFNSFYYLNPIMSRLLADKYETVVHIDADCIVTDRLDEIIASDYDVAIVRNNSDNKTAGMGLPETAGGLIDVYKYANCGLIASTKKEFWEEWIYRNIKFQNKYRQHEQDIVNILLSEGKYKVKILDSIDINLYYGVANAYGIRSHWDSWKDIKLDSNNKLILNDKFIKVLHHAGGFVQEKLNIDDLFSPDVAAYLKDLCEDF
jgi:hypothetical protein